MPRKKKIREHGANTYSIKFEKNLPNTPTCRRSSFGWVSWGQRNQWPTQILGLYASSTTLRACVNFAVKALVGGGIDYDALAIDGVQTRPNYKYDWNELLRRCAEDYFLFGGYCIQVIKNRDNVTYSFYHTPISSVRSGERDEDGVVTEYYISEDWSATSKYPPTKIPSLVARDDGEWDIRSGEPYLLYSDLYSPLSDYYPTPCWSSALKSVQTEVEIAQFDLKNATNAFVPTGSLSMPPVDSEEEKRAILNNIEEMLVGSSNASQIMVFFRNDSDDTDAVKFTPFRAEESNVELFSSSSDRAADRLLSTFSIPSRSLIGLPVSNVGFSSEAALLESSYELYNMLAGNEARRVVLGTINECFRANGIDVELSVKPLVFGQSVTDNASDADVNDISENNIEEQV